MKPRLHLHPLDFAAAVGFLAYSSSSVITPICLVILADELRFSLAEGGAIEVPRSLMNVAVLMLSGFASAKFGKAVSLGASCLLLGAGLLLYSVSPTYGVVLLAMVVMGCGAGVLEGLINPLIQALHPRDSGRYLNLINAFWSIGVLVTMLVGGELLTRDVSWRRILIAIAVLSMVSGLLFLAVRGTEPPHGRHSSRDVLGHKWAILRLRRFWLFAGMMVFAGAAEGAYTFWTASLIQLELGGEPREGGIGTALFAAGMIVGRFAGAWWIRQQSLRRFIALSAVAGLAVSLAVPLVESLLLLYVLLFAAGLAVACFWPSIQSYAADCLPVDATSLFILLSCAGIPGFAGASWLMGLIGDASDLRNSFLVVPALLAGLLLVMATDRGPDRDGESPDPVVSLRPLEPPISRPR